MMAKNRNYWKDLNVSDEVLILGARQAVSKNEGVLEKNIKISRGDKKLAIEVVIEVLYPLNIPNLSYDLQKSIKKNIEDKTSVKVDKIDIRVVGLYFKREESNE